jgi:U3 small nucleolar RNA-associated protein 20
VDFATAFGLLRAPLLSEVSSLRLSAANILRHLAPASTHILLDLICQAESVPMTFQTARERTLVVRKIGTVSRSADQETRPLAICYLIACLKMNLKPLWKEAIAALASLLDSHPDEVWKVVAEQLSTGVRSPADLLAFVRPEWASEQSEETVASTLSDDMFQCKNLNKLRSASAPVDLVKHLARVSSLRFREMG